MDIRPIRNDDDLTDALREIDRLWKAPENTPDGDKLEVLVTLVEAYEAKHYPMPLDHISPRDMLEYAITDMGRSQKELADVLGSRSQASDFLKGRRKISLAAAQKTSKAWNMPIQLLVAPYEKNVDAA